MLHRKEFAMPLIPIDLKPGVYKNGTPYSGKLRWADSNLVRWKDGAIRVIGGWERRITALSGQMPALFSDATLEAPRNIIGWTDNSGSTNIVVGTNLALYHIDAAGAVSDITPSGFTGDSKDSGLDVGYGTFAYGVEAYGTPRSAAGAPIVPVASWSFALWGENLLAQYRSDGPLYEWVPGDAAAVAIATAPEDMQGIIVTDERIVLGIGGDGTPRLIQWSASEDNTDWTPAATNQAGSLTLAGAGPLLAITQVMNDIIVLGQNEVYVGRYLGPPYVYGFERIGDNNGLVSANALVTTARFAMWAADRNFWLYDGALKKLESDVIDFFFNDMHPTESSKTYGFTVREFNEVWWVYQSEDSATGEPDSYICYDYALNHWTKGKLNRTVGMDKSAVSTPVMVSPSGLVFNHELPAVSIETGPVPYCETGPLEIGQGEQQVYLDYIYPDELVANSVTMTIKTKDMPNLTETVSGPYVLASPTPVRARGRQFALRFEGRAAGWRIGLMRANIKAGGRR
jgi:hypothetical protein